MTDEQLNAAWIDQESSQQLPELCERGEGPELEFMREFPSNVRELAKEVAAFATSGSGTILLGVDDDGTAVGLKNADNLEHRDELLKRVHGVCHGVVKPSITPGASFARVAGRTVLILRIEGKEPLYYVHNVPYIRHLTASRPAEPNEVIDLVRKWLESPLAEAENQRIQFFVNLLHKLGRAKTLAAELDAREVNPWFDNLQAEYGDIADDLQRAATDDIAVRDRLESQLLESANALSKFAKLRSHLGSGPELRNTIDNALDAIQPLYERLKAEALPHISKAQLTEELEKTARRLAILDAQAHDAIRTGEVEELQTKASDIGAKILNLTHFGLDRVKPGLQSTLESVGHRLHLAETETIYCDGGASMNRVTANVREAVVSYKQATASLLTPLQSGTAA